MFAVFCAVVAWPGAASAAPRPAWLSLEAGTVARVDIAPWLVSDEPEAALTESARSLERNFSDDASRPGDVIYRAIGVRVRVVALGRDGRTAHVRGIGDRFEAFAPIERLIPEIPTGTVLVAAGGFGGFSDFYPTLATPEKQADRIATGSRLVALGMGVAPYDPDSADLVRVRVRALDGNLRGRTGWLAVGYTGLPVTGRVTSSDVAEKACNCRLVVFR
jgi:hypothetical protein